MTSSDSEEARTTATRKEAVASLAMEYPVALTVRNTFLDFPLNRPESLEGFIQDRQVHSAPGSRLEHHDCEVSAINVSGAQQLLPHGGDFQGEDPGDVPPVLYLASLVAPESSAVPNVGSQNHDLGRCKPCAFVWKELGCENGEQCPFCHLCEPGERKRRHKEKKERIRAFRRGAGNLRHAMAAGLGRLM